MEEKSQAIEECLEKLLENIQQYGETEWRKKTSSSILQVLGLKEGLDSLEGSKQHAIFFQNLSNDVSICLKYLQTGSVSHKDTLNQFCFIPALCGTLMSGRRKDILKQRNQLVDVISEVEITQCDKKPYIIFWEFATLEEQTKVENDILPEMNGKLYSSRRRRVNLVQAETEDKNIKRSAAFVTIPISHWKPKSSEVSLTGKAVKCLQKIESFMMFNRPKAKSMCINFFELYGSHFLLDKIQLGGIFEIEILFREKSTSPSKEMRKKFIEQVLLTRHLCKLESLETGTAALSSKSLNDEFKLISTNTFQYGGAHPVCNFPLWQKTLSKCESSWIIVNKKEYESEEYIGVWTFIEEKCETFKNAKNLANFVADVWINLVDRNDDRCFWKPIDNWKDNFVKKREELVNESESKFDFQILLDQLNEGESKFGYIPVQNAMEEGKKSLEPFLRKIMDMKPQYSSAEKHHLWHGLLNVAKKYGSSRHEMAGEITTWLRKHMFNEFVLLPCPLQDVKSTSSSIETILLPAVTNILSENVCKPDHYQVFFRSLTSIVQKAISCAMDELLSAGNTQQYLTMYSDALTLGYDFNTAEIKGILTIDVLQEYALQCKMSLRYLDANTHVSASVIQAWALKNIIFHLIHKKEIPLACLDSAAMEEREKLFCTIIKTMLERGLKFDTIVHNIIHQPTINLNNTLKQLMKITGISMIYYEGHRKQISKPTLYEDFLQEKLPSREQKALLQILSKMNMTEFYPEKLSLQDVLKIHENQFTEPASFSDLPWAMLRRIIGINFEFREETLHKLLQKLGSHLHTEEKEAPKRQLISSRNQKSQTGEQYHPADVFLALFQCFDSFLKRLVVQKMQICQVAVPLVYRDYERELIRFSLWPIRDIFIDGGSESVATKEMQTLAFIGIGDKRKGSKSRLINQLLRSQNEEHSTFFHKSCHLGHLKRAFADGTIEISWYIPKFKSKNVESESVTEEGKTIEYPLTILNLRGDASSYTEQLHFLLKFANALVIYIDYEDIKCEKFYPILAKIHASEAFVIIVINLPHDQDETEQFIQIYKEKTDFSEDRCSILSTTSIERDFTDIEVKEFLINDIHNAYQYKNLPMSLEEISYQLPTTFYSDEELPKSLLGQQLCNQIISQIEGNRLERKLEKKNILPLQGVELWHEWSNEQKIEHRSGKKERFDPNEPHLEKMRILRLKQVCVSEQISDIMAQFVDILVTCIYDKQTMLFFLSWMRQFMDSRSRAILPKVMERLNQALHDLESIRPQNKEEYTPEDENKIQKLKAKISEEERNLVRFSFGLEHFFREMGQLYEAFMYCKNDIQCRITTKTEKIIDSLPSIAAKLLLWGQPLEVMDGDVANVPIKWIYAVFSELSKEIGKDKRLFAISVLGIQSSGKSTLLNTMFGLQFAVSAGRCTRGIFIQLVPIDKNKSSLEFDYAMVIDTEGLRAPVLASEMLNHDNELATLVIGMGDVTIVNIKGETIADMGDVLQIVVHALIRLKQANEKLTLQQSCIIAHQNVSEENEGKLTFHEIVKMLNKMTVEVAKEEHVTNIRAFQDVIGFNSKKHVKYIPDLWHGNPPMAPASLQYSLSVDKVAECILKDSKSDKTRSYLSVENTRDHLQSLWNGILSENFVFSFRNVLEVKAYSLLEKKFQELTWQLEELKLKWINDSVRPTLRQCDDYDKLESHERSIYEKFFQRISAKTKAITEELNIFFKESDLSEHLVHWQGRKNAELESTFRAIISDVKHKLHVEKEQCKALMESNDRILKKPERNSKKSDRICKNTEGKKRNAF